MHTVVDGEQLELFYGLYLDAFGPLRTRAVARQVLHRDEFEEQMADEEVWKFVAWDSQDQPVGLTTLTRNLGTVPWISPEYFAARYPEHTARNAVYYWGFTLTQPGRRRNGLFFAMLTEIAEVVAADQGVCGYDICAFNNHDIDLGNQVQELSHRLADVSFAVIDTQTYYCATLS